MIRARPGPESANDGEDKPYIRQEIDWIEKWLAAERPFLGICLGAQMLARALGAPGSTNIWPASLIHRVRTRAVTSGWNWMP